MNELKEFLELNHIEEKELFSALHLDMREIILKIVCDRLKKDQSFFLRAKKVFFSTDDLNATKKVIDLACGCKLSKNDMLWMMSCITAFFSKGDTRRPISQEEKRQLLENQGGKCAICNCEITIQNMHVDHIIPWDYVGDELSDNFQCLCQDCNLSKSNHVAKTVTNLILYRR